MGNRAENQGLKPETGSSQAQAAPGTSSGPPPALLLTPSAGTQARHRGSQMPGNGLGGQTSRWSGPSVGVPGPALPGPHQTAKHTAPLRQADNQPFQSQGSLAGVPRTCFSLAPVSQSLGVNDSGNNERGAGLSS